MSEHELVGSAVVAWMCAKGIELVKNSKFLPWLNTHTEELNRWVARFVAFAAAFGIHTSFDSQAGVFQITGLTIAGLSGTVLEYARQYMLQEIAYKKFIRT